MESKALTSLRRQLETARAYSAGVRQYTLGGDAIVVPGAGRTISSAYEQLRNAAEYGEGRHILQHAIKRFYKRLLFMVREQPEKVGQELVIELVQSGYLQDGQYGTNTAKAISKLATEYMHIYARLREAHVPQPRAHEWVLAALSVRTDDLLQPYASQLALASFAHDQFLQQLPKERLARTPDERADFEVALYVAIHQALLKSNLDVVRTDLLRLYNQTGADIHEYALWNERIERLYSSPFTARLKRLVSKNGAPYRVLKGMSDEKPDTPELLANREQFIQAYSYQINREYGQLARRLNAGLIKSIIFLLITKSVIGLGVEVPFDLWRYGVLRLLPLTINLLFPPLYMATIRLGVTLPTSGDARKTAHYMEQLLYGDEPPHINVRERAKPYSPLAKTVSTILFLIPFGITVLALRRLEFNLLQVGIFFIFFSTASFLGFRLSGMVRELKMSSRRETGLFPILLDFFYLPFIQLGQWLAGKYAAINVVGEFLDTAIELPLKSVLRLLRLWIRFLNEKYDELY